MTDVPTTEQLAGQLAETAEAVSEVRAYLAQMQTLAEQAHAVYQEPDADFVAKAEAAFAEGDLVAALPVRPPVPRRPVMPPRTFDQEALAAQGINLVAQHVPDWNQYAGRVLSTVQENPVAFSRALSSGDPATVGQTLAGVYQQTKTSDANRQMKLAAQSAVGASGRPAPVSDDAAEWAAIKAAMPKGYWE